MRAAWWPAVAIGSSVLGVWACGLAAREALGPWSYALFACGLMVLGGAWGLRRWGALPSTVSEHQARLARQEQELEQQRQALQLAQQELTANWEQQTLTLEKRQRALVDKLSTFQEWMEFPEPVDVAQPPPSAEELRELAQKDHALLELLRQESERLFNDIAQNKYAPDGKFHLLVARDDVLNLITRVAKIYQPTAESPLLETSLERIFRAASRACLEFLVVLEELPLNVPQHDLNSIYAYVRQAVKAYGVYRSAEPYFPYLSGAYYLGRFALGASPVTLGAWWVLRSLGTQGAKALMTRMVNRQALNLLHSVVRVIGFEVASMYSTDFRHRDANWIYATEVTDLASRLPLAREGLAHALKELGVIQLRNEYDRVFLYRCLAEHRSAQPERYGAAAVLTSAERQAIAARLERFLKTHVDERPVKSFERWRLDVEQRLDVKLALGETHAALPECDQVASAVRSLAGFLLEIKEREVGELPTQLARTRLYSRLNPEQQAQLGRRLHDDPPFYFQPPDIDPGNKLVEEFLDDLVMLSVRVPPHPVAVDELLAEVAGYLRQDGKALRTRLQHEFVEYLAERLPAEAPDRHLPAEVAKAVLELLAIDDQPRFVYGGITFPQAALAEVPGGRKGQTWLLGVGSRLLVFSLAESPQLIWEGAATVQAQRLKGYLLSDCELTGGRWLVAESSAPPLVRVAGAAFSRYEAYFAPLLAFCRG